MIIKSIVTLGMLFSSTSFAAIAPENGVDGRKMSVVVFDRVSGEACSIQMNAQPLTGVISDSDGRLGTAADGIVSEIAKKQEIAPCSGQTQVEARQLMTSIQTGQQTAFAPAILIGIGYYAVCTAVNAKATVDAIGSAMVLGANAKWGVAEWASATVCLPVTATNLGLMIIGTGIASQFDKK